jgi:hypothetical protein
MSETREKPKLSYWLEKLGQGIVLLAPTEVTTRLAISGDYTGPEQVDEGMCGLFGGLAVWDASKYIEEHKNGIKRSPIVVVGRAIKLAGTGYTAYKLQTGDVDNIFRTFAPAALGIAGGSFLEYVAGPVHEKFSKKYKTNMK